MDDQREVQYLGVETLLEINRLLGYNGLVRDQNMLESALGAPKNAAYYEQADLIMQTAVLIERLVLNHPFVDGNKRSGLIAGSTFLLINGLQIVYQNEDEEIAYGKEIEHLVVSRDLERFLQWLQDHIQPFEAEDLA